MSASSGCNARPCTPRRVVLEPCALSIRQMALRLSRVLGPSAESPPAATRSFRANPDGAHAGMTVLVPGKASSTPARLLQGLPGRYSGEHAGSRPGNSQITADLAHQEVVDLVVPGNGAAPVERGLRRGSSSGLPAAQPSAKPPALHAFVPGHSRLAPLPPSRSTSRRPASQKRCKCSRPQPRLDQKCSNRRTAISSGGKSVSTVRHIRLRLTLPRVLCSRRCAQGNRECFQGREGLWSQTNSMLQNFSAIPLSISRRKSTGELLLKPKAAGAVLDPSKGGRSPPARHLRHVQTGLRRQRRCARWDKAGHRDRCCSRRSNAPRVANPQPARPLHHVDQEA